MFGFASQVCSLVCLVFSVFRVFCVIFGLPVSAAVFDILCVSCILCYVWVACLCCVWYSVCSLYPMNSACSVYSMYSMYNAYAVFWCVRVGQLCCGELCAGGKVGTGE